ncbi:glycoside hydrolase family 65 protein [Companilactobacillus futsaii]|uniref:glycoside hydrolase family 65 protein n=1 Tax=Companilactobacillus futsaii TaxID=938155 RepID=UPI0018A0466B|nr:glycoside hydrolase family 65 protein [Companilactobacillus futsaii]
MKPLYLKITEHHLVYSNDINTLDEGSFELDSKLKLKQNFHNFKENISDSINVIVIMNSPQAVLKKNVFRYNNEVFDFGDELENIFHIPVINYADLENSDLNTIAEKEINYSTWHLDYYGISHKKRQYGQESMQTIGNGFLGLRGTYLEAKASVDNYPATYVADVFNQLATPVNNRNVINEDLVNLPNAQYLSFKVDDGDFFKIDQKSIQESLRSLNLKSGILTITNLIKLDDGKELKVIAKKIADLKNYHNYYLQYKIQPLNFSGKISVISQTDGSVINSNVDRYKNLAKKHLSIDNIINENEETTLLAHTSQSKIKLAIKTNLRFPQITDAKYSINNTDEIASQFVEFSVSQGQTYTIEKDVAIFTSLEIKSAIEQVVNKYHFPSNFDFNRQQSLDNWQQVWNKEDVTVIGDITAQKLLRLNSYSMTSAAQSNANKDLDASVGSRGLTGEGYRGHIFWDELFDMNFYILHAPQLVKSLLMYRYNRLGAAMDYASDDDYNGAMYPWQSGMYGDEQSQEVHLNPLTKKWDPDNSRKQRHVSLAIAYNIWNYYNLTENEEFMKKYGLEMLLQIAKFWIDMSKYDEKTAKYSIENVMGPDEFHEGYPKKDDGGLKNNAYTNIMVSWLFKQITKMLHTQPIDSIKDNLERTDFNPDYLEKMNSIRHNLKLDFQDDILGQFEGYFDLKELDFDKYRQQYGNISRMDRILKAHNDSPDNYKVAKQADTLMALFNIRESDFLDIMKDLNYPITNPNKFISDNIQYYIQRTTHGSTLSRIVYSMLLLKISDDKQAWKLFYEALTSDYYDIQGGTTAEGIHLGVMGATLNVVTSYFAGVDYRGNQLEINPHMPKHWKEITFKMLFKGVQFSFKITKDTITIVTDKDTEVQFIGKDLPLTANQEIELTY